MSFENYTDCLRKAYQVHTKQYEVLKRKQEIVDSVAEFHNFKANTILYVGFNPLILNDKTKNIYVTKIDKNSEAFLKNNGAKFTLLNYNDLANYRKYFDVTIAFDEYFTFSQTDSDQKKLVAEICNVTKEYVITTCKDYKNQEFKDKEFSIPALIRGNQSTSIYLEFHNQSQIDRNSWTAEVFEIYNNNLTTWGPYQRRTMFFKQLAKFSSDFGAVGFTVHKNLMYKSLIKKNYEHIISIQLDNGS